MPKKEDNFSEIAIYPLKQSVFYLTNRFDFKLKDLDQTRLKYLKSLIRNDPFLLEPLISTIFIVLKRSNSNKRIASLLICDEFFARSHEFRRLLVDKFSDFLRFTAETDGLRFPLPDPREVAENLKIETFRIVKKWRDKFGPAYNELNLAYDYLNRVKSTDFERINAQLTFERERATELEARKERINAKVVEKIQADFDDIHDDIIRCLTESESALELLYPKFIPNINEESTSNSAIKNNLRLHGVSNNEHHLTISVNLDPPVVMTTYDNSPLLDSLIDSKKLLSSYVKKLVKWLHKLSKIGENRYTFLLKQLIDMKESVTEKLAHCQQLNIKNKEGMMSSDNDDDDNDDDFEDVVDKEGLELNFETSANDQLPQYVLDHFHCANDKNDDNQPGSSRLNIHSLSTVKSSIPTLDFGLDLKYWGHEESARAAIPRMDHDCHRFGRHPDESDTMNDPEDVYGSRLIAFSGKFEPILRECRHSLSTDGQLCTRKDRLKCPFHGMIVDRDDKGVSIRGEMSENPRPVRTLSKIGRNPIENVDESCIRLAEMESCPRNIIKRVQKRQENTAKMVRNRLKSRIFDRKSLKRVGETLDAIQQEKARRKFAHQFPYVFADKL